MSKASPRGRHGLVLAGIAVLVCSLLAGPVPSMAAPSATDQTPPETSDRWLHTVAPAESYDAVDVRIDVAANGSAQWYVEYRYDLPTEAAIRGFERTQKNITNPPGAFVTRFEENVVAAARSRTGRSMRLESGQVQTELDVTANEGVVVYQFRWTNFAARTGEDPLVAGDAIAGYDLSTNESLMIEWPDRLEGQSISPEADFSQDNAVRWTGPVQFRTEDPTVVLQDTGSGSGTLPVVPIVVVVAVLALVVAAWYGHTRWWDKQDGAEVATAHQEPELLSDEERVLQLLDQHGGRMKQQDLIEAVDWSRTKASDVVNEMHRNEQIELFRLGRENVLALPGEIEI